MLDPLRICLAARALSGHELLKWLEDGYGVVGELATEQVWCVCEVGSRCSALLDLG